MSVDGEGVGDELDGVSLEWLAAKPGVKWTKHAPTLAAWVADMDFPPAPVVVDALQSVLDSGDLGYPAWPTYKSSHMPELFARRMEERFGWRSDPGHAVELNDVMHGLHMVLHLCTEPGDGLVTFTPAYPPFFATVDDTRTRLVQVRAERVGQRWEFDHEDLDRRLTAGVDAARVLLVCNPHNPTGRVFGADELESLATIARRHGLVIISDEIHADLVHEPHRHIPMATIAPDLTVTLTSASKAFNLAGLRWAIMHVGPTWLRDRLAVLPGHILGAPNLMAVAATRAAWTRGDPWLDGVRARIGANRLLLADLLAEHLPDVEYLVPEATYLTWLDARRLAMAQEPGVVSLAGGVALSPGTDFGENGRGFARLNIATSPAVLTEIVTRVAAAWQGAAL